VKRSKTTKQWLRQHVSDEFVQRARREGYRSRAAFKLLEISERDRLLKTGQVVVDLGAAPGSWAQVALARAGPRGRVIALDLLPIEPLPGVVIVQGDFREQAVVDALDKALGGRPVDLVLCDMSPNISGIAASDQARAMHLAELALEFSRAHLKHGGAFLVKVFQGAGFEDFLRALRACFQRVVTRKPRASRGSSSELYLLGTGFFSARASAGAGSR
jgi:23S rRNA (uridine2552-2'-O)-methyltransferase